MPLFPVKDAQPSKESEPLYQTIQNWVYRLETSLQVYRIGLFGLLALFVALVYTGTQFQGLRDPEAMDMGQLGRNLARHGVYVTQVIRPLEMWHLQSIRQPPFFGVSPVQPELMTPPVYPWILSSVFRTVQPEVLVSEGLLTLKGDRILMVTSWAFFMVALLLVYVLARLIFDERVAALSCYLFLFCDALLDFGISGTAMPFLMVLFLVTAIALVLGKRWQEAARPAYWVYGAIAVSALAVGVGTLTRYGFAALALPVWIYVIAAFPKPRWAKAVLWLGLFLLVLGPWVMRNRRVSRTWFGLTRYEMYESAQPGVGTYRPGQLQRMLTVNRNELQSGMVFAKAMLNGRQLYENSLKAVGSNYLIAFFLVALLHRFRNAEASRLRRWVFWSLVATMIWVATAGVEKRNFLTIFMPAVVVYSAAYFYVLFERLQFRRRITRRGIVVLFVAVNAIPLVYTILPPRTNSPYPPYSGGVGFELQKRFHQTELLASDIPWAVAWYANRSAIWIPFEERDYIYISSEIKFISGIYLTQVTLQDIDMLQLLSGKQQFLLRLLQPPSSDFPLRFMGAATPDRQQIIISHRPL